MDRRPFQYSLASLLLLTTGLRGADELGKDISKGISRSSGTRPYVGGTFAVLLGEPSYLPLGHFLP